MDQIPSRLRNWLDRKSTFPEDSVDYWRERILLALLFFGLVAGSLVYAPSIWYLVRKGEWGLALLDTLAYAFLFVVILHRGISFRARAAFFAGAMFVLGLVIYLRLGPYSGGPVWLFAFPLIAGILLGTRAALAALGLNALTFIILGLLIYSGQVNWLPDSQSAPGRWLVYSVNHLFVNGVATIAVSLLLAGISRDVTRRKKAEEALRQSEQSYRDLFENAPVGIFRTDSRGAVVAANPAMAHILDLSSPQEALEHYQNLGNQLYVDPVRREHFIKLLGEQGQVNGFEYEALTARGRQVWLSMNARLTEKKSDGSFFIDGFTTDMTARKQAEEEKEALQAQLRQAQKMEAVGTLAGGIAHDFNNILSAIIGFTELAQEDAREGKTAPEELKEILKAASRAKALVKKILAFSRKLSLELRPIDLNRVIGDTAKVIARTISKMISVELHLSQDLRPIKGDGNQIEQVLLNMAGNAQDAMPGGGKLIMETSNLCLSPQQAASQLGVEPGDYVVLTVTDTGMGMDQTTLEHIFEPFFTTKGVGKGTGLGLFSVYGVVKGLGGHITCQSQPGRGTTFKIYFPALPDSDLAGEEGEQQAPSQVGGSETILIVDDEESLRALGSRALASQGYQVLTAASGEEALDIFTQQAGRIDLVVMDLGMPGMGGLKCLHELLVRDPQTKVVIASGYAAQDQVRSALEGGAMGYVAKPFLRAELLATVRRVLDQDRPGSLGT